MAKSSSSCGAAVRLRWKHKLLLLIAGILLPCLALEFALRVKQWWELKSALDRNATIHQGEYWAMYDRDLGYRGNPKFSDYNSDGLRSPEIGPKGSQFRILVLGDSVAVGGDSVADTFPAHLQAELRKNPALEKVEVINGGVLGYTNYQQLLFLKKYAPQYEPDLLLVQFCLNDLHKYLHSFRIVDGKITPGSYHFSTEALKASTGLGRLARESYLLSWLAAKFKVARAVLASKTSGMPEYVHAPDIGPAWHDEYWPEIEKQLGEMKRIADARRIPILLTVTPARLQYDPAYVAANREFLLRPQQRLAAICQRLGIPFYDLYPDLEMRSFKDSLHTDREGRQIIGRKLAQFLGDRGVLPSAKAVGNGK